MPLFSERYGYTKVNDVIIKETITLEIKNTICNWYNALEKCSSYNYSELEKHLWIFFLNQREADLYGLYNKLKEQKITVKKQYISARKLAIYISSDLYGIDKKTGEIFGEHIAANELIKQSPILSKLKLIFRQFKEIMAGDNVELLQNWIDDLNQTEFKNLRQFLRGVQIDQKVIFNAIRYKYTNGLVEGNVNRLKNKKREMYGRAGFELLRRKVCLSQTG